MAILTAKDLNKIECSHPKCDHTSHSGPMAITPRCHPNGGLQAAYFQDGEHGGFMEMACKSCGTFVMAVKVAAMALALLLGCAQEEVEGVPSGKCQFDGSFSAGCPCNTDEDCMIDLRCAPSEKVCVTRCEDDCNFCFQGYDAGRCPEEYLGDGHCDCGCQFEDFRDCNL